MCKGVNTYPRPLVYEVAAQSVPGPSILYLNWAGIIASREEVLAARLLVDTFGLRLHTLRCHMRNVRFCCCGAKIVKTRPTKRDRISLVVTHLAWFCLIVLIPTTGLCYFCVCVFFKKFNPSLDLVQLL